MARKVFISYRRDDSRYQARMIYHAFERESVFMDVDSISPGSNYRKILKEWVDQCDVLLALIGPGWIDAADPQTGQRRRDNRNDFVRIEIGEALARGIPVVPLLLDGTHMPEPGRLPVDLQELPDRQAEIVQFRTFDPDVARLIRRLGLQEAHNRGSAPPSQGGVASHRADGRIKLDAKFTHGAPDGWFKPGAGKAEWFKDHEHGPYMVVLPAGSFVMGSPDSEPERATTEGPRHQVAIDRPFAIGRAAVTRGQFAAFVKATSHVAAGATVSNKQGSSFYNPEASWRTPGIPQDDSHPALCISWADAKAYAAWLSQVTGQQYRLPSEAEWEYACRAGTATPFWWGSSITPAQVNYDYLSQGAFRRYLPPNWDYSQRRERRDTTVPVDQFAPNPWGLYQVHGNAWEWCEDAWHDTYDGAPLDGSAWMQGDDVSHHVLRGGHLLAVPAFVRAASRVHNAADQRNDGYAIRLARML